MAKAAGDREPLELPGPAAWSALGLRPGDELHAGHQSRVFHAQSRSGPVIVKLTDGRQADPFHQLRVELVAELAEANGDVVGPLQVNDGLVAKIDDWHVVCYPFIAGSSPDSGSTNDVVAMAAALARLHESLKMFAVAALPPVAALRHTTDGPLLGDRIIHGDYASANLIATNSGMRVIDFDECGYGSIEFEIGNSLYMVLFDAWLAEDHDRYRRFRDRFVGAYRSQSSATLEDVALDEAIRVRLAALSRWLDNPAEAPIGIRMATPEWHHRLRLFIDSVRP